MKFYHYNQDDGPSKFQIHVHFTLHMAAKRAEDIEKSLRRSTVSDFTAKEAEAIAASYVNMQARQLYGRVDYTTEQLQEVERIIHPNGTRHLSERRERMDDPEYDYVVEIEKVIVETDGIVNAYLKARK